MPGKHAPARVRLERRATWDGDCLVVPEVDILLAINRHGEDTDWHTKAACTVDDAELFFSGDPLDEAAARDICITCKARTECADYAIRGREQYGMYGGLTPEQRDRLTQGGAA